jgi:uncharacterized protein
MSYDPLYLDYLIYFNRDRDYFECHEVMEELWLSRASDPLYKGLLQVAVGLFHSRSGNAAGSLKMLKSAASRLASYPDDSLGIHLGKLKQEVVSYIEQLNEFSGNSFPHYDLTIEIADEGLRQAVEKRSGELKPNVPLQLKRQRGPKHELRGKDRT